ncbi:MAG: hypothetical protein AAFP03_05925 [Cyanobacteria bacterium J06598_3]
MKFLMLGGLSALLVVTGAGPLVKGANAQVFSSQRSQTSTVENGTVPSDAAQGVPTPRTPAELSQNGAVLQTTLEQDETLYLNNKSTYDYDLVLRSASSIGSQRLPVGTIVRGQFEPFEGGLVYRASSVEVADRIYQVDASSELLHARKDPRQISTGAILTDAAIGAAGGYVLGEVLGDAGVVEVIGGAAAGVLVGNTTAPFVVVVNPEDAITLYAN